MMKKLFFLVAMLACTMLAGNAQSLEVYLSDTDGPYTNVRKAPKGTVVARLSTSDPVMFAVESPKDGWWKISGGTYWIPDEDVVTLKGSTTGYWVHSSVLALGTRNYGGQRLTLRQSPADGSKAVYSFSKEIEVRPLDLKGDWVKVKTMDGKHVGWIEAEWLCGNALTNCC